MKTRTTLLILGLSSALALASSCGKSPSEALVNGNRPNLTIRLSLGGAPTRTPGSAHLDDSASESAVSSLRLFLVSDDTSNEIRELVPGTDYTPDPEDPMVLNAYLTPSLYEGSWLAYAFANWPEEDIPLNTTSYASLIGSYSGLSSTQLETMWEDGCFPMVNARNAGTESGKLNGGVRVQLKKKDVEIIPAADIVLERLAAKVRVSVDPYVAYGILGTEMGASTAVFGVSRVVIDGIAMINNVNSFNLIQQWSSDGKLITPSSAGTYSLADGYYNTAVPPTAWKAPGTVMYCLENNAPDYSLCGGTHQDASEGTRMKGRVTGLIIRAHVETLSQFISEADTDPTDGEDHGENLIVDPTEGVWTRAAGSDADFRTFYKYNGIYFADATQLFAQNPSLGSDTDPDILRSLGVQVYENGYMYYTCWIETGGDQYVARNVFYDLSIDSISAFGDDLPGGADYSRTDPLKTDDPKISVSLKIADWDEKPAQDYTL